ncbi:MAG: hypothetical protein KKC05_02695, partial [Nanoarchaeota archaeon]|nr:hypothetical protein [Nanoarchaeota archaeon]
GSCIFQDFGTQADGEVNVTMFVNDIAGNIASAANRNWTIDSTGPSAIDFVSPTTPNGTIHSNNFSIEVNASFTETYPSTCFVEIANATATNYTGAITGSGSTAYCYFNASQAGNDGTWNYSVYITDISGNVNVSQLRTITFDVVAPGLSSWYYSAVTKNVSLTFNESVDSSTIDVTKINITSQDGSKIVQFTTQTTSTYSYNASTINFTLLYAAFDAVEDIGNTPLQIDIGAGAVASSGTQKAVVGSTNTNVSTFTRYTIVIPNSGDWVTSVWNSFNLPLTFLQTSSLSSAGNYSVQKVLESVEGNYETIYYYNTTSWTSYLPGRATNDFTTFSADDGTHIYWINISTTDRLEIQ